MGGAAWKLAGCAVALAACFTAAPANAVTLPTGFHQTAVLTGLNQPTAVRFAPSPSTTVFVAEKSGIIKAFHSLDDPTPTTVKDLRTETMNWWDRGLLGLAVDPAYPQRPYIYAMYARDAVPGGNAPRWGQANTDADDCTITVRHRLHRDGPAGPDHGEPDHAAGHGHDRRS